MFLCSAKEVLLKQTTSNNILHTEVSSKLFYSLTIVFFPQILSTKPQSCSSFLFAYLGDTPPSQLKEIEVVYEASTVVSQLLNACKT